MNDSYDFSKGRRGPVNDTAGKTRITMYLDTMILDRIRNEAARRGIGYQTLINEYLRDMDSTPITIDAIREVVRSELAR